MTPKIKHGREHESIEAKARWFQSLSIEERLDVFCEFTELALTINPHLKDPRDVNSITGRIRILSAT
jgi:hypothetical protein